MFNDPHQPSRRHEMKRLAGVLVATLPLVIASSAGFAQSKTNETEKKLDELSQKVELLDRSTNVRFDALDKVRGTEIKALDDKLDVKNALADVKKDLATNAQKSIDWWFAGLAIFMAVFAVAVPIIFTWNLRAKHKSQIEEIERLKRQVETAYANTRAMVSNVNTLRDQAQADADAIKALRSVSLQGSAATASKLEDKQTSDAAAQVAESKEASLADRLFARAIQSYRAGHFGDAVTLFAAALAEHPGDHLALYNLGASLIKLAHAANTPEDRQNFLARAEEKLQLHAQMTGRPSYNLACVAAMRGDAQRFIDLADASPADGLPDAGHLSSDKDLDTIRSTPEFQAWWKRKFGDESVTQ